MTTRNEQPHDYGLLSSNIAQWAAELGFDECGITHTHLEEHERHLLNWLDDGFHGEMQYMQRHGTKRSRPEQLEPGTQRIISVRMNYLPEHAANAQSVLDNPTLAYVSRYALGKDYHKLMRRRLQRLAHQIEEQVGPFGYRAFVDSAPVLEKALAQNAGLGWIGKHSNLLNRQGSWFFLGEIYTDLPLPVSEVDTVNHCGECRRCMDHCPTGAIVEPYKVDARLCISYLTIEYRGSIPENLRAAMGNRIYGCDDCQLYCPWNRFSENTTETAFEARHSLDATPLCDLFAWSESEFLEKMVGSPVRRIGYECWLRNIAVALGNAPTCTAVTAALETRRHDPLPLVREHTLWALSQHGN